MAEQIRKLREEVLTLRGVIERPPAPPDNGTLEKMAGQLRQLAGDMEVLRTARLAETSQPTLNTADSLLKALQLDERLNELLKQKEIAKHNAVAAVAASQSPVHAFSPFLRWSTLGFAVVGAATGLFAGMSQSPVVAALLPLLFGLLGGAGGLFIAKMDLHSPVAQERIRVMGSSIVAFMVLCMLGSIWGLSRRTGQAPTAFFTWSAPDPISVTGLAQRDAAMNLQLVLLRSRLQALGATPAEQAAILQAVAAAPKTQERTLGVVAQAALTPLKEAAQYLQAAATGLEAVPKDSDAYEEAQATQRDMRRWSIELRQWAARVGTPQCPKELLENRLEQLDLSMKVWLRALNALDDESMAVKYFANLIDAQVALTKTLYAVEAKTAAPDVIPQEQLDAADALLRIMRAQAEPQKGGWLPLAHVELSGATDS
ncbi:MAG: hypothetical protein JXB05_35325 [Myxococcaceae bacterium]|nr:hypothetical protein [Myxococcaceae bacterium]